MPDTLAPLLDHLATIDEETLRTLYGIQRGGTHLGTHLGALLFAWRDAGCSREIEAANPAPVVAEAPSVLTNCWSCAHSEYPGQGVHGCNRMACRETPAALTEWAKANRDESRRPLPHATGCPAYVARVPA